MLDGTTRWSGLAAACAATLLMDGQNHTATAQSSRPQLLIQHAVADLANEALFIEGRYFVWANDSDPVATLAGFPLAVIDLSDTRLVVHLPAGVEPGSYRAGGPFSGGGVQIVVLPPSPHQPQSVTVKQISPVAIPHIVEGHLSGLADWIRQALLGTPQAKDVELLARQGDDTVVTLGAFRDVIITRVAFFNPTREPGSAPSLDLTLQPNGIIVQ